MGSDSGQLKTVKAELNICWRAQILGQILHQQYAKSPGWWRWYVDVGKLFMAHFGPDNTNQSSLKCHSLFDYCY